MKKIVGTIAAIALAASSAFAGVGIGSWGRAIWAPVQGDGDKVTSWEGISWGGAKSRVGISVHGESENVGFNLDMNGDGGVGLGDLAQFWAKPFSWLEVKIGQTQDDTGRGNAAYGIFNWKRMGGGFTGEDVTFTRFGNGTGGQAQGAIVKITPIENLWIIAAFNVQDDKDAKATFVNNAQYGAGYTIDGIGSIRAQYIGGDDAKTIDGKDAIASRINAAFDLTAVENLFVTVGAYIPLASTGKITPAKPAGKEYYLNTETGAIEFKDTEKTDEERKASEVVIAAYANVNLDAVTLHALFKMGLGNTDFNTKANLLAGVGADVDFGNGIGANFDARLSTKFETAGETELVFLAGLTKSLANGMIGCGFQGDVEALDSNAKFKWAVPVVISACF